MAILTVCPEASAALAIGTRARMWDGEFATVKRIRKVTLRS
ncbi:hypothetical protein AB0M48_32545 [Lentzea sp. NPDC051208]